MTEQPETPTPPPFHGDRELGWQRTPGVPVYGSGDQCPPPDLDAPMQYPQSRAPQHPPQPQQPQPVGPAQPHLSGQQPAAPYAQEPAQQQVQPQTHAPHAPQITPTPQAQAPAPPAADFPWPSPVGPAQTPGERAKALGLDWPQDDSSTSTKPEPPSP